MASAESLVGSERLHLVNYNRNQGFVKAKD